MRLAQEQSQVEAFKIGIVVVQDHVTSVRQGNTVRERLESGASAQPMLKNLSVNQESKQVDEAQNYVLVFKVRMLYHLNGRVKIQQIPFELVKVKIKVDGTNDSVHIPDDEQIKFPFVVRLILDIHNAGNFVVEYPE